MATGKIAAVNVEWRVNLFKRIENILIQDSPALPLFIQQNRIITQPYVKGIEVPPLGFRYLEARKIWLDKDPL